MKSTLALRTLCMTLMLIFSMSGAWASHHNLRLDHGGTSFYDKSCQMRFRILDQESKTVALIPRSIEDVPIDGEIKYSGDIVLPNSVTYDGQTYTLVSIGDSAYYNCQELTSITLNEGLTSIGDYAFNGCTSLRSELKLQGQIKTIGRKAFYNCTKIPQILMGKQLSKIGEGAFSRVYGEIKVEEGSTSFRSAEGMLIDVVNKTLIHLHYKTASLQLPSDLLRIGDNAMENCSYLTTLTLNEGLQTIGYGAFNDCKKLTSLQIPASVTEVGRNAFYQCKALATITVAPNNANYKAVDNCLLSADGKQFVVYPVAKVTEGSYQVPAGVERIIEGAFAVSTLEGIILPESLREIEATAFFQCNELKSLEIPNEVRSIGRAALSFCKALKSVSIGSKIKHIGRICFAYTPLTALYIKATTPPVIDRAFAACFDRTTLREGTLFVPKGSKELYEQAEGFQDFSNIVEQAVEQKPGVTIETALPVGSKMKLKLKYDDEITITGLEEKPTNNQEQEYTTTAQSILIEGLLTELECTDAQITTLRLSGCDRLSVLDCSNNEIKELDLQEAPHLEILICSNNQITALDLSATPDLSKLWCSNNKEIKSLDLSHATNLMGLWCYGCSLSELDLSACSSLTGVDCTNNKLSKLSLGNIDYLTRVACANNLLKQIDLSGVPNLDELLCGNNSLTSLQLSAVPYLTTLKCPNNQLSTLDLTSLQDLKNVHCQGNQLSKLDLSKNRALEELYCYENQIKGEEMTALVTSLRKIPQDTYENLMLINSSAPKEQNHPMVSDIQLAKAKGWTPKDFQGGINDGAGVPFEGFTSTTQITHRDRPQVALLADRTLVITEAESDTVTLYAVDGSILYCAEPSLDGEHRIQLSSTTGRTIILLIGTNSYKILVP